MSVREKAGRPRDPAVDSNLLAATREIVLEAGYGAVSIGAVARRAGVSRPTVYRRWRNKAELAFDALFEATEATAIPDAGDLSGDLVAIGRVIAADLSSPAAAQALVGVMADVGSDSDIARSVRDDTIRPRADELAAVVERAQHNGTARADTDPHLVIHALAGVLYYHAAVLGEDVSDELVEAVVGLLVNGAAADAPDRSGGAVT